jgi:mannose-1-phosphate guanylyltransferase/mannose-6-phosphate isomerase
MEGETAQAQSTCVKEVERPWGGYQTVSFLASLGSLKLLRVAPNQRLSLQRHAGRSEHWVVLQGEAVADIDGEEMRLVVGDHVEIPRGAWHRLSNRGSEKEVLVAEVQVGGYADSTAAEEDIERKQDDYGRS